MLRLDKYITCDLNRGRGRAGRGEEGEGEEGEGEQGEQEAEENEVEEVEVDTHGDGSGVVSQVRKHTAQCLFSLNLLLQEDTVNEQEPPISHVHLVQISLEGLN